MKRKDSVFFPFLIGISIVLTALVLFDSFVIADRSISRYVQVIPPDIALPFMKFISLPGNFPMSITLVLLVAAVFIAKRHYHSGVFIFLTLLTSPINETIKLLVARARPNGEFVTIYSPISGYGFPSGHVMFYVVFFGFLLYLLRARATIPKLLKLCLELICIIFIVFIGISRIYLGVHWFTDVLGGYLFGLIVLLLLIYLYRLPTKNSKS